MEQEQEAGPPLALGKLLVDHVGESGEAGATTSRRGFAKLFLDFFQGFVLRDQLLDFFAPCRGVGGALL